MRLLVLLVLFNVLTVAFSARIVVIFALGSKSHFIAVKPAIEALAERGHRITLFTPYKGIGNGIENVNEIELSETRKTFEQEIDWFAMQREGLGFMLKYFDQMASCFRIGTRETLQNEELRRIIHEKDVDLFIADGYANEFTYSLADLVGVPFVTHCPTSPMPMLLTALGGPGEYASVPLPITEFADDMSFFERMANFLMSRIFVVVADILWTPIVDQIITEEFPNAKLPRELFTNVSIMFVKSHPTTTFPRALPPTVIPIGALHTRPARELPQDLKKYADDSKRGFVVFSLGTFVPGSSIPKETLQCFMRVFSKLPLNVICKWEAAVPEDTPSNVLMLDWIPQQDLLGHPNAKLFISHGGMMGTQEAIYHGVPILGLPFGNDQKANLVRPKLDGYAVQLDWDKIDDENLFSAINHLLNDPKVRESVAKASKLMRDEPISGKDLAVYWIEYVLRHNGTKHMQLAAKDLPFYKQYLFDVFTFLFCVSAVFTLCFLLFARFILRKLFSNRLTKLAKEKAN